MNYKFSFSFIIPIYNTEEYLEETLLSLINQSIGFLEHIELVLINNASEDGSALICEKYVKMYPNNIQYIQIKENKGVGLARNQGTEKARGKYINYFDSDDKWGKTALEEVKESFEKYSDINIITCREKRFEALDGWHSLDFIFQEDFKIHDISKDPYVTIFAAHATFFRIEIAQKHIFDPALVCCEDMKYMATILLEEKKFIALKKSVYYYRERKSGMSANQSYSLKKIWYTDILQNVFESLIEKSNVIYGNCIPFLQCYMIYHLQVRIRQDLPPYLTMSEIDKYRAYIKYMLDYISDVIIASQRLLSKKEKINLLAFKYGENFSKQFTIEDNNIKFSEYLVMSLEKKSTFAFSLVEIKNNTLVLYGRVSIPTISDDMKIILKDKKGNKYYSKKFKLGRAFFDKRVIPDVATRSGLQFELPLGSKLELKVYAEVENRDFELGYRFERNFPLTDSLEHSCFEKNDYMMTVHCGALKIQKKKMLPLWNQRLKLIFELIGKRKKTSLLIHLYVYFFRSIPFQKKICIVSDRHGHADDNGEVFFDYLNRKSDFKYKVFYTIQKESPDYGRMKDKGKILDNDSKKFIMMYLRSSLLIGSHFNTMGASKFTFPMHSHKEFTKHLLNQKKIYLQHGVIKDDLTKDNSKLVTGVDAFVVSSSLEAESMISYPYEYQEEDIWLTGLARHDLLNCDNKNLKTKEILIAPTWRFNLPNKKWGKDGYIEYNDHFKEQDFYKFYNSLINHPELLKRMKECGYKGVFKLHPVFTNFLVDFDENDVFIFEDNRSNNELLTDASLLITDYSSIAIEFAYLLKPCIYTQFDLEKFTSSHTYAPGYFDYETHGFGEVCFNLEDTVNEIINHLKNGCAMNDKYKERFESFFPFRDNQNCERIYKKLTEFLK